MPTTYDMVCCNRLAAWVNGIVSSYTEDGLDPTQSAKTVSYNNGLTTSEIGSLVNAVNQSLLSEGVQVELDDVLEGLGMAEEMSSSRLRMSGSWRGADAQTPSNFNKYCENVLSRYNGDAGQIMNTLTNAAGDICFYGCFAAMLAEAAIAKYNNVASEFDDTVMMAQQMLQQMIAAPDRWVELNVDFLDTFGDLLNDISSGVWGPAQEYVKNRSFSEILFMYLKSYVARYAQSIILGAIQGMVDTLEEKLNHRADLLAILDLRMKSVATALANLMGRDWWEDFVRAVEKAQANINEADQSLQRAQVGAVTGTWDDTNLSKAQIRLVVAKNAISSVDMITQTLNEIWDEVIIGGDPFSFHWDVGSSIKNDFMSDLKELGDELDDMTDLIGCLTTTTEEIKIYISLIEVAAQGLDFVNNRIDVESSLDVSLDTTIIDQVRQGLRQMFQEMGSVVENEDRTGAPGYLTGWHALLLSYITGLKVTNLYPNVDFLNPLGFSGAAADAGAIQDLQYILYPHEPFDHVLSLSERDFDIMDILRPVSNFIATAGNIGGMFGNYQTWADRLELIRGTVRNRVAMDHDAADLCMRYSGNESDEYDYIIEMLDSCGWEGAKDILSRGKLSEFVNLSIYSIAAVSANVDCLASVADAFSDNFGINLAVNKEIYDQQATATVALRAPSLLPSIQFKAILSLSKKLGDIADGITSIMDLKSEVC